MMKRTRLHLISALTLLLVFAAGNSAAQPLTNAWQVRSLAPEEAAKELSVRLRAVVTFIDGPRTVFLQDETGGTFARGEPTRQPLAPGDIVEITGKTYPGLFVPGITADALTLTGRGALPGATPAGYDDLLSGRLHYQMVSVAGVVRAVLSGAEGRVALTLAIGPRKLEALVGGATADELASLVDARIRLTGLAAGLINDRRQLVVPQVLAWNRDALLVEQPAPADPFAGGIQPVAMLMRFQPGGQPVHRVAVRGVVTFQRPGQAVFIRDEGRGLYIQTRQTEELRPGDLVEAAGFPAIGTFSAFLEDAVVRKTGAGPAPIPVPTDVREALRGTNDADLVTLDVRLLEVLQSPNETVLVAQASNAVFNARMPRATGSAAVAALRNGSQLRLTGVCRVEESTFPGTGFRTNPRSIELLLRTPSDIKVLTAPSWWTVDRLSVVAAVLLGLVVAALAWVALLRRRVAEQTEIIRHKIEREAMLEERQRVAREMHDTLAQSFSGLGFVLESLALTLKDAPEETRSKVETGRRMAKHGQEEFRRSLMNLRSPELELGGLAGALPELGRQITAGTGTEFAFAVEGAARRLPEAAENHLLRIGQECFTNAVRHARARCIEARLKFEHGVVCLTVADDGVGLRPEDLQRAGDAHFGWRGMQERVEQLRGEMTWRPRAGGGTEITVTAPL